MTWVLRLAGAVEDDGINIPDDPESAVVWVVVLGVIVGLYLLIRRTRLRADEHFRRRRDARDELDDGDTDT